MSKKKPAKRKTRYLEFGKPVVITRPPDATPADLVKVLGAAVVTGRLPAGWDVEQPFRNSPTGAWKQEPVLQMVKKSARRGGDFVGIYLNRFLKKQANRYGVTLASPRRATAAETARDERTQERTASRESGEFEALAKFQKRSAAAKRGWVTRRAKQAKTKRKRRK
jgi:hypothetical protein